mmetsp:Transcript_1278/g.3473  ORF Transcript_1278/g.3473 Transcript_1278/m.3473 type:complete len:206 (+) Transcript_1278:355-972(+)
MDLGNQLACKVSTREQIPVALAARWLRNRQVSAWQLLQPSNTARFGVCAGHVCLQVTDPKLLQVCKSLARGHTIACFATIPGGSATHMTNQRARDVCVRKDGRKTPALRQPWARAGHCRLRLQAGNAAWLPVGACHMCLEVTFAPPVQVGETLAIGCTVASAAALRCRGCSHLGDQRANEVLTYKFRIVAATAWQGRGGSCRHWH